MPCAPTSVRSAHPTRRRLIQGSASLALWGLLPGRSLAATRDPRLLIVVLRGALDGLALAAPVGDPAYANLRGAFALPRDGLGAGLPLDDFFALNPAMPNLHALYRNRQALIAHAVATPYRERSHFDGQDVLESGLPGVGRIREGWLNRALQHLPSSGRAVPHKGLAIGPVVPLIMRGEAPVLTWSPKVYGLQLAQSTAARLMDLYAALDPQLSTAFAEGLEIDRVATADPANSPPPSGTASPMSMPRPGPATPPTPETAAANRNRPFIEAAENAAKFLSAPDGPRVGVLSYDGWDTHANEGATSGPLAQRLAGLDAGLQAFVAGMGAVWQNTVVAVVTEFGRTAAINGTAGTDHGTATTAILLGGAIRGGRMLTDWPGLAPKALHEGRDLAPTLDVRALFKGLLKDHLGLSEAVLSSEVFPDSARLPPQADLIA